MSNEKTTPIEETPKHDYFQRLQKEMAEAEGVLENPEHKFFLLSSLQKELVEMDDKYMGLMKSDEYEYESGDMEKMKKRIDLIQEYEEKRAPLQKMCNAEYDRLIEQAKNEG